MAVSGDFAASLPRPFNADNLFAGTLRQFPERFTPRVQLSTLFGQTTDFPVNVPARVFQDPVSGEFARDIFLDLPGSNLISGTNQFIGGSSGFLDLVGEVPPGTFGLTSPVFDQRLFEENVALGDPRLSALPAAPGHFQTFARAFNFSTFNPPGGTFGPRAAQQTLTRAFTDVVQATL